MAIKAIKAAWNHTSHVWTGLENLIKLAQAADVPLCGGAFTVASQAVAAFNGSAETRVACNSLLHAVSSYSDTLWEFVEAMTPDVLKHSQEPQAILARASIKTFQEILDKVYTIAKKHSLRGRISRIVHQATVKEELDECRKSFVIAHARFQATVSCVLVAYTIKLSLSDAAIQRLAANSLYGSRNDPFKVTGAFSFAPHELNILQHIPEQDWDRDDFWVDTFKAAIGEKTTTAKIYYESSGGEKTFLEDVKILSRNLPVAAPAETHWSLSRLGAAVSRVRLSSVAILVTGKRAMTGTFPATVMPMKQYLTDYCLSHSAEVSIVKTWTMLIDLKNAIQFFVENNGLDYALCRNAILDARVNHNGDVMLTPIRDLSKCPVYLTPVDPGEGLELLVKEWFTVFFRRVAFRPLRPLYFAISRLGDVWKVLNTPKSDLKDSHAAVAMLEKWWPTKLHQKEYSWPNDQDFGGGPDFGDVGVFETIHPPKFRKLTNIKKEIPTYLLVGNEELVQIRRPHEPPLRHEDCQLMAPYTYRRTVYPGHCEEGDNYVIDLYAGAPITTPVAGRTVHMFWGLKLHEGRYDSHLYFARNARNIAAKYGVKPWDLVFVCAKSYMLRSTLPPGIVQNLKRPIYAFFYLDTGGPPGRHGFAHWSYAPEGLLPDESRKDPRSVFDVGFNPPEFEITSNHPANTQYLQFERRDFVECDDPETDWTYREPENPVRPPPRSETLDDRGTSVPFRGSQYNMYRALPDGSKDYNNMTVMLIDL